jgi:hypothetical protein
MQRQNKKPNKKAINKAPMKIAVKNTSGEFCPGRKTVLDVDEFAASELVVFF